ncbi:MAG: FimV/HubP family polar landmark protein [Cycloclasticus sp.]
MKKSTKAIAALCLFNTATIYALGVGEIETHSALNQVLKAKIPLISSNNEDPSNVRIGIAPRDVFKKAGIDRPQYLSELVFTPVLEKNGDITIDVRSTSSIKEPFINFILEVEWPQGRTLKEFTILLDPPITMSDVRTTPIELAVSQPITPVIPTNTPITNNVVPVVQKAPAQEYGPTKSRDTVWGIAKTLLKNNHTVTHEQMMLALYDNNPSAFYKKNINALKKGAILHLPNDNQLKGRSTQQALNEYIEQNNLWSSASKAASTTATAKNDDTTQQTASTSAAKKKLENIVDEPSLTLLTPKTESKEDVTVEGNSTETPVSSNNPNTDAHTAIEMATTLEEENKELKSRLSDIETQVEKLQRLVTLQDKQLNQLQSATPTPVADKPVAEPTPAAANTTDEDRLPLYLGGGLLIILLGLFLARRKTKETTVKDDLSFAVPTETQDIEEPAQQQNIHDESVSSFSPTEDGSLLSEFTPSEFDPNLHVQEADPLTECDVYIAYGRYQQAEDLMQQALSMDPGNLDYKLKLLNIYFASANSDSFEELAKSLSGLKESDSKAWNQIAEMGEELCPSSALFLSPFGEEVQAEPVQDIESTLDSDDLIEDIEPVSPEEIQEDSSDEQLEAETNETGDEFEFDFDLIKNEQNTDESVEQTENDSTVEDGDSTNDTKLSLAQAYIEMEDLVSAREALEDVVKSGDESQKQLAEEMLKKL